MEIPQDRRIAFFDRNAPTWDTDGPDPGMVLRRLAELQALLGLQPGQDLLEVGCGTGQITAWLSERVRPGRVHAVDFSPEMLARARARKIDADFHLLDVCRDLLEPARFDVVFCFHAFPHFRDQAFALRNFAAALKPGGALMIMHLKGSAQINAFHDHIGGPIAGDHLPGPAAWRTLLPPAGLRQTDFHDRPDLFFLRAVRNDRPLREN